ncbi:UNVERIFIED_CONTAM: hypothetical protein Sradi_6662400 [Sesamum radiatum]|uniref:Uncharacterized protein n=1 Tax=Sesamum radiatum TaxID=300843 RepID=A0AAW2JPY9_SESRA
MAESLKLERPQSAANEVISLSSSLGEDPSSSFPPTPSPHRIRPAKGTLHLRPIVGSDESRPIFLEIASNLTASSEDAMDVREECKERKKT